MAAMHLVRQVRHPLAFSSTSDEGSCPSVASTPGGRGEGRKMCVCWGGGGGGAGIHRGGGWGGGGEQKYGQKWVWSCKKFQTLSKLGWGGGGGGGGKEGKGEGGKELAI